MPVTFPNESPEYRAARDELLRAETELRGEIERVAAMRRALPLGGEIREDYAFEGAAGRVCLSGMFGDKPTLFVYNFMFSPEMERACSGCSSILDALNGQAPQIMNRVALAVVARNPLAKIREYAEGRGWGNLPLYSCAGCDYNVDYHGEKDGEQYPMANVFSRGSDGVIRHFWGCEMLYGPVGGEGQHQRQMDSIWPLWNLLDMTPEGRGEWPPLPD